MNYLSMLVARLGRAVGMKSGSAGTVDPPTPTDVPPPVPSVSGPTPGE